MFHCIACTCNCRQCCDVRPNTHVRIRGCAIPLPKLEGKICFNMSHAPAVPSDTAGLCDMCAILIQGRYYSLSKTNLCLYVIKSGFINFRHLRSDVTDVHPSRPYYLAAWLHNYFGRRQFDLWRSGYYGTQPRRVRSSRDQRDPLLLHTRDILE